MKNFDKWLIVLGIGLWLMGCGFGNSDLFTPSSIFIVGGALIGALKNINESILNVSSKTRND